MLMDFSWPAALGQMQAPNRTAAHDVQTNQVLTLLASQLDGDPQVLPPSAGIGLPSLGLGPDLAYVRSTGCCTGGGWGGVGAVLCYCKKCGWAPFVAKVCLMQLIVLQRCGSLLFGQESQNEALGVRDPH